MVIYKITNLVNGKLYIGKTVRSIAHRWRFSSVTEASIILNINDSSISRVCLRKRKRAGGYTFQYMEKAYV